MLLNIFCFVIFSLGSRQAKKCLRACTKRAFAENIKLIEKLQNEFLRHFTNSKKNTPIIYMLHAELGRKPITISIKSRMAEYWLHVINSKDSKLSKLLYNILLDECNAGIFHIN